MYSLVHNEMEKELGRGGGGGGGGIVYVNTWMIARSTSFLLH